VAILPPWIRLPYTCFGSAFSLCRHLPPTSSDLNNVNEKIKDYFIGMYDEKYRLCILFLIFIYPTYCSLKKCAHYDPIFLCYTTTINDTKTPVQVKLGPPTLARGWKLSAGLRSTLAAAATQQRRSGRRAGVRTQLWWTTRLLVSCLLALF
jgi:hypothetical protein